MLSIVRMDPLLTSPSRSFVNSAPELTSLTMNPMDETSIRGAVQRALIELDPEQRPVLKAAGLLTRDARAKESKKYGLKKARKAPQYSKR